MQFFLRYRFNFSWWRYLNFIPEDDFQKLVCRSVCLILFPVWRGVLSWALWPANTQKNSERKSEFKWSWGRGATCSSIVGNGLGFRWVLKSRFPCTHRQSDDECNNHPRRELTPQIMSLLVCPPPELKVLLIALLLGTDHKECWWGMSEWIG